MPNTHGRRGHYSENDWPTVSSIKSNAYSPSHNGQGMTGLEGWSACEELRQEKPLFESLLYHRPVAFFKFEKSKTFFAKLVIKKNKNVKTKSQQQVRDKAARCLARWLRDKRCWKLMMRLKRHVVWSTLVTFTKKLFLCMRGVQL